MGWIVFIILCVVVYYLFILHKSSRQSKTKPTPYLMTPTIKSTTQGKTTDYTDLPPPKRVQFHVRLDSKKRSYLQVPYVARLVL